MVHLTRLLQMVEAGAGQAGGGQAGAAAELAIATLYDEIRRLARGLMRRERNDHTLAPTALANEAWLRLFGTDKPTFGSGAEFFAAAATTLRRILVEHGRQRARHKRGGGMARADLDVDDLSATTREDRLLDLDAALSRLAKFDPDKARLVELRFFAGLTVEEAARVLAQSERTVAREWRAARAFLRAELQHHGGVDELDA